MTLYTPEELRTTLGTGLLSFPVTHATAELAFDEDGYRDHIAWLGSYAASGLFAAGGTGEFFSLVPDEVGRIVRAAVAAMPGDKPVIAPAGYGTAQAVAMARDAEAAGAHGVFLLPPYLTELSQDGLVEHVKAVCAATSLGVVVYHRANAAFGFDAVQRLADECPNFIGFKDGIGDVDLMTRIYARLGDRLLSIGGLPTAETYALPYLEMGVTTYSSAIFNFLPEWAVEFYAAVRARDAETVYRKLDEFVLPYLDIRNRRAGYAVSIVKAGLTVIGRSAGPVRPPLTDLTSAELDDLTALVTKVTKA
ncbi:5-dehydro-4-deoxyglucarate dehydratase [Actinoalloteichus hymeniacidonis]|uniref:Probable 5-dehydro-4-deoxyglucarate dehydratase n=1 Tax=Actinoalloteichus hymeniacidonis TaxID=340345 RepID=A0AAC9MYU4_9PSEU|nr:5-dehydro-4-deoxyglucarate dehydratase [Actinoalloteichus hymeniacidonis]AOS64723.1 5-dehydro-4-deoxyglucarate dehydratase [Actinoalloteichus hymeniacidonis]MBB5907201.1 5-dehydro-4-deoxyglucarate dehydratase [Actinoalloteichus hymeniacidonis]